MCFRTGWRLVLGVFALAGAALTACGNAGDASGKGTGGAAGSSAAPSKNLYVAEVRGFGGCLVRPLAPGTDGRISCGLTEAHASGGSACPACGASPGRSEVADAADVVPAVREYLMNVGLCGQDGEPACSDFCYCDLLQFSGAELLTCESSETDPGTQEGFCYVDPAVDANGDGTPDANPALLAKCDTADRRILRYMGTHVPASDGLVFLSCEGATAAN